MAKKTGTKSKDKGKSAGKKDLAKLAKEVALLRASVTAIEKELAAMKSAGRRAPAKKTAAKAPVRKAPVRKAPARKATAKKPSVRKTVTKASARGTTARSPGRSVRASTRKTPASS